MSSFFIANLNIKVMNSKHIVSLLSLYTFPILFLYTNNYETVEIKQLPIPLLISFGFLFISILLYFILTLKIEMNKSFLIIIAYSVIFLFYGHFHLLLYNSEFAFIKIFNKN